MASVPRSRTDRLGAIWAHCKFWIALVVTLGLEVLLLYTVIHPFVSPNLLSIPSFSINVLQIQAAYSSPYIVLLSFLSLSYLSLNFVLNFPTSLPFYSSKSLLAPAKDKHVTFLHLYLFTWLFLVLSTVGITFLKPGLGGGYLMSAWNTCVGLAFVMGCIAEVVAAGREERVVVDNESYEELEGEIADERDHREHHEPDESTPLIQYPGQIGSNQRTGRGKGEVEKLGKTWWWIPQFIVSVPLPVILFAQVTMLVLDSMSQTLSDGSSVITSESIPFFIIRTKCSHLQYMRL